MTNGTLPAEEDQRTQSQTTIDPLSHVRLSLRLRLRLVLMCLAVESAVAKSHLIHASIS